MRVLLVLCVIACWNGAASEIEPPHSQLFAAEQPAVPLTRSNMDPTGFDLKGKVALVTGASRGIGRAIAVALAGHGARVALHYRAERQAAEATQAALGGDQHPLIEADLADPEAALALADRVVAEAGQPGRVPPGNSGPCGAR